MLEKLTSKSKGAGDSDAQRRHADHKLEAQILKDVLAKLRDLRKRVIKNAKAEWEDVFLSNGMEKRLDTLFQMFTKAKEKLELDFSHKPFFVDKNPYTNLVTINGEPIENDEYHDQEWLDKQFDKAETYTRNEWFERFHDENYDPLAMFIYVIIVISIIVSVITTIASTIPDWADYTETWFLIELIVTVCFTVEYIAKIILVRNRFLYALRIMNVFDLLAILPFYFQVLMNAEAFEDVGGVLRALRLTRMAKIRQLASPYTTIIMQSTRDSFMGAGSSVAIFLFVATVITGTLVYSFEHEVEDSGFDSIPIGMWFAVVTMTTVGYGDFYPTSTVGMLLGVFTILVGLVLMSLVVMVVGNYYIVRQTQYLNSKDQMKEEIFVLANFKKREFQLYLKKYPVNKLFPKIWAKLRKREEKKAYWWWSTLVVPGAKVRRDHTFGSRGGIEMGIMSGSEIRDHIFKRSPDKSKRMVSSEDESDAVKGAELEDSVSDE